MTATAVHTTSISLELGCCPHAHDLGGPRYLQLSRGPYDVCSVLETPESVDAWRACHRTARKRADRSARLGYRFAEIRREQHNDDIYRINTSLDQRQGRPMADSYRRPQKFVPLPDYRCNRHRISTYGVLAGRRLVAYLWLYRCGSLALVSSILGHGAHLADDIMYLLAQGVIGAEADTGGYLVYNRWDSGTDGLRYYKSKVGFSEQTVEWLP